MDFLYYFSVWIKAGQVIIGLILYKLTPHFINNFRLNPKSTPTVFGGQYVNGAISRRAKIPEFILPTSHGNNSKLM